VCKHHPPPFETGALQQRKAKSRRKTAFLCPFALRDAVNGDFTNFDNIFNF
jgi:hypothetical protein